jgi:predicted phosphoribosyltransferase
MMFKDRHEAGRKLAWSLERFRSANPVVLALPAGGVPVGFVGELEAESDETVFLATPEPFYAVGLYYANFSQTSDEEVIELLSNAREVCAQRGWATLLREVTSLGFAGA